MNIWPEDFIYGEFRASDMGLIPGRFDGSPDFTEDEIGMSLNINEEFIGNKVVPVHISTAHSGKLLLSITLVKNPCIYKDDDSFNEYELRGIMRKISKKYQWTRAVNTDTCEDIWFRCVVDNVFYNRLGNKVYGVTLSLQCDSLFGYSNENKIVINAEANKPFYVFNNTDELEEYVLPIVEIKALGGGTLSIENNEDNRVFEINNVEDGEILFVDNKNKILKSSEPHSILLNDFNMNWIRLLPDKNTFVSNMNCRIEFVFRVPRKAGVV